MVSAVTSARLRRQRFGGGFGQGLTRVLKSLRRTSAPVAAAPPEAWSRYCHSQRDQASGGVAAANPGVGANLTGAHDLNQEQLNAANGDSETKLPAGLQRPEHWLGEETSRPE